MENEIFQVDSSDKNPIEKPTKISGWSEIPPELLMTIQSKFPLPFLHVRSLVAICSSWKTSLKVAPLSPLMFSLPSIYDFDKLHVLSLQDMRIKQETSILQKGKGFQKLIDCGFCVGFSRGWLIVLDKKLDVFLLNPFSGKEIELGRVISGVYISILLNDVQLQEEVTKIQCTLIKKAILSASPDDKNIIDDYKVVIICNNESNLAIYSNGDKCWSWLSKMHRYSDIAFSNNKIYALHKSHVTTITEVWDIRLNPPPCLPVQIISINTIDLDYSYLNESISPWKREFKTYIVISSMEEIFYIRRYMEMNTMLYRTVGFKVFRMDSRKLVQVDCLENRALFLGGNESKMIPSEEYQGLQGDCIYFHDDSRYKWIDHIYPYIGYDTGVYMLSNRSLYLHDNCPYEPMPYWVLPRKSPFGG